MGKKYVEKALGIRKALGISNRHRKRETNIQLIKINKKINLLTLSIKNLNKKRYEEKKRLLVEWKKETILCRKLLKDCIKNQKIDVSKEKITHMDHRVDIVNFKKVNKNLRIIEKLVTRLVKQDIEGKILERILILLQDISLIINSTITKRDVDKKTDKKIKELIIKKESLKKGDIIFSYKTKKFLKEDFISYVLYLSQKSRITHCSIVYTGGTKPKILSAQAGKIKDGKTGIFDFKVKREEIIIVMKPKNPTKQYFKNVKRWKKELEEKGESYSFAEMKSWFAVFMGFIYIGVLRIFKKDISVPNIFKKDKGFFCSEFVDNLFKEEGILLTPGCKYDSMVGPGELIYSPYFEFKGIIINKKDIHLEDYHIKGRD